MFPLPTVAHQLVLTFTWPFHYCLHPTLLAKPGDPRRLFEHPHIEISSAELKMCYRKAKVLAVAPPRKEKQGVTRTMNGIGENVCESKGRNWCEDVKSEK